MPCENADLACVPGYGWQEEYRWVYTFNWDTVALVQATIGTENVSLPFFTSPESYVCKNYTMSALWRQCSLVNSRSCNLLTVSYSFTQKSINEVINVVV